MSEILLGTTIASPHGQVVGVVTRPSSPFNADFRSLEPLAIAHEIPVLNVSTNNQDLMADFVRTVRADVAYCFGWPFLIRSRVLEVPPLGMVGFHPTELPKNRGRHPLIWALALGLERTASTFFQLDEGADSGPILQQDLVAISEEDDARSLYDKISRVARSQIEELTRQLAEGVVEPRPQNHEESNTWRRRTTEDGRIDWRMQPGDVYNLVRALTRPYVGAHIDLGGAKAIVWRCKPVAHDRRNDEPGKVVGVDGAVVDVRCHGGAIRLLEHTLPFTPAVGDYL